MSLETVTIMLAAVNGLFIVATPILLYLVNRGTIAAAKIANVNPMPDQIRQVQDIAFLAINYTKEQVNKLVRGLATDGPTTSEQKLEVAVNAMKDLAKPAGIHIDDASARIAIEATLAATREGAGAHVPEPATAPASPSQTPPPFGTVSEPPTTVLSPFAPRGGER